MANRGRKVVSRVGIFSFLFLVFVFFGRRLCEKRLMKRCLRGVLYEAMYLRVRYNTWTMALTRCQRVRTMARRWSEKGCCEGGGCLGDSGEGALNHAFLDSPVMTCGFYEDFCSHFGVETLNSEIEVTYFVFAVISMYFD